MYVETEEKEDTGLGFFKSVGALDWERGEKWDRGIRV